MRLVMVVVLACVVPVACSSKAAPAAPVTVDGSSTVYPLSEAAAALFEKTADVPVQVAFSGTVVGFGKFCRGQLDVLNASRPISKEEQKLCEDNAVSFVELPVAYDAVTVVVNTSNTWASSITIDELRRLWEPGAEGRVTRWTQIRKEWPDRPIALFGPGSESGTFEFFNQQISGDFHKSRKDYTASGDDSAIVHGVTSNDSALGYVGYSYFQRERKHLKAVPVDDLNDRVGPGPIEPTPESVSRGTYHPLSRPLLIYVNAQSVQKKPNVKAFAVAYVRNARDLATEVGSVPLMPSTHKLVEQRVAKLTTGTIFNVPNVADAWLDLLLTQ